MEEFQHLNVQLLLNYFMLSYIHKCLLFGLSKVKNKQQYLCIFEIVLHGLASNLQPLDGTFWRCLVSVFKQHFLVFKQHFTYFHTLFHPHEFPQKFLNNNFQFLNTCTKRTLNIITSRVFLFCSQRTTVFDRFILYYIICIYKKKDIHDIDLNNFMTSGYLVSVFKQQFSIFK